MEQDIFFTLLSSSVLATIITSIFNIFVNGKKLETNHITNERKTWRDQIRNLSQKINHAEDLNELKKILAELKLSINAYGLLKRNQYLSDGHLWQLITEIEQLNTINNQALSIYQKFLTELLSVLLKYDWERSKLEIKGNSFIYGIIVTNLWCAILGVIANVYYFYLDRLSINASMIYELISLTIVFTLSSIGFLCFICKIVEYILQQWVRDIPIKFLYTTSILVFLLIMIIILDSFISASWGIQLVGEQYKTTTKFAIAGVFLSGILTIIYTWDLCRELIIYKKTILQIFDINRKELKIASQTTAESKT